MTAAEQAQVALKDAKQTKLVLLGTGDRPQPGRTRHMTSHVMLSNGAAYVLDCGLGVTNQFARTGIPFGKLRSIFITHHHPDHNNEYGPLLVAGRVQGLPLNVRVFGPPPLKQVTEDLLRAYKTTIDFWAEDPRAIASGPGHRQHQRRQLASRGSAVFQGRDHCRKGFDWLCDFLFGTAVVYIGLFIQLGLDTRW